jgi:8-oxo-dGTP diphosphatase
MDSFGCAHLQDREARRSAEAPGELLRSRRSAARKLLLVDHRLAGLWLPSGGHVEPDEDPHTTVVRELAEELNLAAEFVRDSPLFITVTRTVGQEGGHTDVSLWYLLRGDISRAIEFDRGEFHGVQWFGFDEIPFERSDPHLCRFVEKMRQVTCRGGGLK